MAVAGLGLDPSTSDALSSEAVCASLRRAASFLCPASPRRLVDAVLEALAPLDESSSLRRDDVADLLNLLVSVGDLIELRREADRSTRELYLGPPSYVEKAPGQYLVLGVRPGGASLVDEALAVEYEGHARSIQLDPEDAAARLRAAGLHSIRRDHWLKPPRLATAADVVADVQQRLTQAGPSGEIDGLTIVDPQTPVHYYRGRRRPVASEDSGDFVGRRPQAYGSDLWCVVRIAGGESQSLVDLPFDDPQAAGSDEAWRLQAAVDADCGRPQEFRIRAAGCADHNRILDLFGPIPSWGQRYLELVGLPLERSRGALVSYRMPTTAVEGVSSFLTDMLWMGVSEEGGSA